MPKKDPKGKEHAQNIVEKLLVNDAVTPKKINSDIRLVDVKLTNTTVSPPSKVETVVPQEEVDFVIPYRCNRTLHEKIKGYINARHQMMDYRFTGVSDFFRHAIQAYMDGMVITEDFVKTKEKKVATTFRVNETQYTAYKKFPDRHKTAILERVIRTYYNSLK